MSDRFRPILKDPTCDMRSRTRPGLRTGLGVEVVWWVVCMVEGVWMKQEVSCAGVAGICRRLHSLAGVGSMCGVCDFLC